MEQHKLGETILIAIIQFEKAGGDMQDLIDSLLLLGSWDQETAPSRTIF